MAVQRPKSQCPPFSALRLAPLSMWHHRACHGYLRSPLAPAAGRPLGRIEFPGDFGTLRPPKNQGGPSSGPRFAPPPASRPSPRRPPLPLPDSAAPFVPIQGPSGQLPAVLARRDEATDTRHTPARRNLQPCLPALPACLLALPACLGRVAQPTALPATGRLFHLHPSPLRPLLPASAPSRPAPIQANQLARLLPWPPSPGRLRAIVTPASPRTSLPACR